MKQSRLKPELNAVYFLWTRWRQRWHLVFAKTRQQFIAHGQMIDGGGEDDRSFLHVVFDDPIIRVHVRMPGNVSVFDGVLLCADTGQTCLVKRSAVRAAKPAAVRGAHAIKAEIFERRKDRLQHLRSLRRAENAHPAR